YIDCIFIAFCDVSPALLQCLMGISPRSEPITMVTKLRFIERREYLGYCLLDYSIHYRGYTQLPLLPTVFGYLYPQNRIRAEFTPQYGCYQFILVLCKIILQGF